jgi:hypothetical protein
MNVERVKVLYGVNEHLVCEKRTFGYSWVFLTIQYLKVANFKKKGVAVDLLLGNRVCDAKITRK